MITGTPPLTAPGYFAEGAAWWSPAFADSLEWVNALVWPESIQTYGKMRFDPQLASVISAVTLPIRQAPWFVDPAGCRPEVVQLVADDLGLPILGKDAPGPARRRGIRWAEHLRLACNSLVFGHYPFAEQYEIRDGQARLIKLSERLPSTITQIDVDEETGDLKSITQFGETEELPAEHLVWYVHDREGAAWQGRSILRPAYAPWLLKHEMWRVHAISITRFGMGIPNVEAPPGATPAQIAQAAQLAQSMRAGDQAGVGLPNGFKLHLSGMEGSVPDALAFMNYLDMQMSRMVLAQALNLGQTDVGSRSLGETFIDLMITALNAEGGSLADTATGLSVKLVDYNWGEDEPAPRIICGDVGSRPQVTAQAISTLLQAGALGPDPALERWVRERWSLPERETPFQTQVPGAPATVQQPGEVATPEEAETETAPSVEGETDSEAIAAAGRRGGGNNNPKGVNQYHGQSANDGPLMERRGAVPKGSNARYAIGTHGDLSERLFHDHVPPKMSHSIESTSDHLANRYGAGFSHSKLMSPEQRRAGGTFAIKGNRLTGLTLHVNKNVTNSMLSRAERVGWLAKGTGSHQGAVLHAYGTALMSHGAGIYPMRRVAAAKMKARVAAFKAGSGPTLSTSKLTRRDSSFTNGQLFAHYHLGGSDRPKWVTAWGETFHRELGLDPTPLSADLQR